MRWPGAFLYMPWILEWNVEEFKIHIHCCFKNICPKNISSGRYERGQNSYPPLFKNFKVPTNGGNLSCFSYFTDTLIQVKVYLIYITKLRVYLPMLVVWITEKIYISADKTTAWLWECWNERLILSQFTRLMTWVAQCSIISCSIHC